MSVMISFTEQGDGDGEGVDLGIGAPQRRDCGQVLVRAPLREAGISEDTFCCDLLRRAIGIPQDSSPSFQS
ncbi:hypothetical protein ACFWTE_27680 [Nocardiopsis sp. NPDC058631]|uniref:hypothetical protein n=1 Tax=Nocardiopsis sp. NPDC058631 TaxID=3346566 RepID=UPI003650CD6A